MGIQLSEPWSEEVFIHSDGAIFHLETATGESSAIQTRSDLQAVANAVHPRGPNDIPDGVGTCLKESFIATAPGNEDTAVVFSHPTDRPISLEIGTSVRKAGGRPIRFTEFSSVPGIRNNPVSIAGFAGRELTYFGGTSEFYAEIGQHVSQNRPGYELSVSFSDTRRHAQTQPMTREDAERIWETVIRSIRVKR